MKVFTGAHYYSTSYSNLKPCLVTASLGFGLSLHNNILA